MRAAEGSKNPVESWHGHQARQPLCVRHALPFSLGSQVSEYGYCRGRFGSEYGSCFARLPRIMDLRWRNWRSTRTMSICF